MALHSNRMGTHGVRAELQPSVESVNAWHGPKVPGAWPEVRLVSCCPFPCHHLLAQRCAMASTNPSAAAFHHKDRERPGTSDSFHGPASAWAMSPIPWCGYAMPLALSRMRGRGRLSSMPSHVAQAQHLKAIDPSSGPKVISHGGSYRWRLHRGQGAHCNPFSD